jgi:hypothetical protein
LHNRVKRFPAPRRAPGAAVNDQPVRILRHLGIEIIHQHPQRGFLLPAFAAYFFPARSADRSFHSGSFSLSNLPARMAAATRSMSRESARSSSSAARCCARLRTLARHLASLERPPKFQALRRREQFDREHVFRVLHDRAQLERTGHSHRDVIFLPRGSRQLSTLAGCASTWLR